MSESLKPCPFCGADGQLSLLASRYVACCENMDCAAYPIVVVGKTQDLAAEYWNQRVEARADEAERLLDNAALTLNEAGNVLRGVDLGGTASLMDSLAERIRAFLEGEQE